MPEVLTRVDPDDSLETTRQMRLHVAERIVIAKARALTPYTKATKLTKEMIYARPLAELEAAVDALERFESQQSK